MTGARWALALCFVALRAGSAVEVAVMLASGRFDYVTPWPVGALMGASVCVATAMCVHALRRRRPPPAWAICCDALLVGASALGCLAVTGSPAWTYPYSFVIVVTAALSVRRPGPLAVAVALVVAGQLPVADSLLTITTLVMYAVATWIVAQALLARSAEVDAAREAESAAAVRLAAAQEEAAQLRVLEERVLRTFAQLEGKIEDVRLREHVALEQRWLRDLVSGSTPGGELAALLEEAASRAGLLGVRVQLEVGAVRVSPDVARAVAGAVHEALANVARHAGVETATVTARLESGSLVVCVRDEGVGFTGGRGFGLRESVEGRIAAVGGTAAIRSAPGAGTSVELVVPSA